MRGLKDKVALISGVFFAIFFVFTYSLPGNDYLTFLSSSVAKIAIIAAPNRMYIV